MYDTLSKRLLFLAAAAIVVVTLGYTQHLPPSSAKKSSGRWICGWKR